ncbi:hypothetical protein HOLleu_19640 [Holothuria leucospilota]|uniref:Tyr recombinase domain-containing protein n=1 Tax=Holothuria leucospilota TaxID=206669 RepID=A0A9Q1C0J1_HOLLE|nr:hypothetical protein HOLleu_19640 [Holothuria leucospilota]
MRKISEKAGCTQKYTNHSLRATTCTVLDEAGIPSRHIMSVTGHRSESSLKHYSCTSDQKKKLMSKELANQTSENVPEVQSNADAILDNLPEVLLTNSQEQPILNESNQFNIRNSMESSSIQQFHFHGPVTFYDK